ncbi:uncharacterized protein LOC105420789 [Amborella trichopoda]|uniref:uncharacterized protein LOC105420789 n=1 Tax=Amborella trichopoda TaxID=13333 RepID=UPI0005D410B3|nr:uncharacterized protein LOC105420789 [Amborella trichopoda]|eukprot:XP_011624173.1 uncharacterized protein LOC105420789 [Amborella trichopoda]
MEEFFKLNFNGSSFGNLSLAGFGGIVREWNRVVVFSFSGLLGEKTTNFAELMALFNGLKLFVDKMVGTYCVVEGNLSNVINWYNGILKPLWEHRSILLQNWDLSRSFTFSFVHVFREANVVADYLAKGGSTLTEIVVSNSVISF